MSLLRATGTIGGLTLVSRILGVVREMLMARFVGAGLAADAFNIAWRLPNLFRALFAEGAFASVFVPMFNRTMAEADRDDPGSGLNAATEFAGQILSVLFPLLLIFTAVMIVATAPIVWAMTGGFPDGGPAKLALTVNLTRITFPYLALISLVSLLGGILNSLDRFWVNAVAPVLLNLCMIASLLFFRGATPVDTAHSQAIAVTVSGAMQLIWLIWSCRRAGVVLRLGMPRLSPSVVRLLTLIGPAAVGAGAVQFNLFISSSLAARYLGQGAVSYLNYADRLNQLPLGLIGIGVGTAILPTLSRQIGSDKVAEAQTTQNRAMELALFLALPAAVALVVSAVPIVRGLLERGAFTAADTIGTASTLAAFSVGIPAYVLIKVLTPGFYARQDTKTPLRIAVFSMLFNLVGNLTLIWSLGYVGIAISTAIAAWVNVILLYWTLHRRDQLRMDARFKTKALRIAAASLVMGVALWLLGPLLDPFMTGRFYVQLLVLGALCGLGAFVYGVATFVFGTYSLGELKSLFRRSSKA